MSTSSRSTKSSHAGWSPNSFPSGLTNRSSASRRWVQTTPSSAWATVFRCVSRGAADRRSWVAKSSNGCPGWRHSCLSASLFPVAQGRPTGDYPWFWDVYTWVEGESVPVEEIDAISAAHDLAAFVAALQKVDSASAPAGRGIPLAKRDEEISYWLARFAGDPRIAAEWDRALRAPPWDGPPVWHHGDLDARNWLVRDGRISAVIDWAAMGVGDPACDVMVAWKLHSSAARDAFREALPTDDATWQRARGWALSQAVAALAYYTPENNPILYREAEAWLDLVLSESA